MLVLAVGSFSSFMGLGTLEAIVPLMRAERGSQITGNVEGALLLFSGIYYKIEVLPSLDADAFRAPVFQLPTCCTACERR